MLTVVEQLDVEFNKLLEETDIHSLEYAKLLEDETRLCQIIDSLQTYVERLNFPSELCRLYLRKMEHLYYRIDPNYIKLRQVKEVKLKTVKMCLRRLLLGGNAAIDGPVLQFHLFE
jgi:Eukaryotic translation initiation factor 3 subunit 8 N-terminus